MWASVADVVSVPGPRFSLASESAVSDGSPALHRVSIRFGKPSASLSVLESVAFQVSSHHYLAVSFVSLASDRYGNYLLEVSQASSVFSPESSYAKHDVLENCKKIA